MRPTVMTSSSSTIMRVDWAWVSVWFYCNSPVAFRIPGRPVVVMAPPEGQQMHPVLETLAELDGVSDNAQFYKLWDEYSEPLCRTVSSMGNPKGRRHAGNNRS
jgi:hypothetical protein